MDLEPKKVAGVTTRNGKPVWTNAENKEPYSEKSSSFNYGDAILVTPTIDPANGKPYDLNQLFDYYDENGPYDMYTGEKLPMFEDEPTATAYSKWRSQNLFNTDLTEQQFYTGESDMYSPQDGSDITVKDRIKDAMFHAGDIKDDVVGFFGGDAPEYALGGLATANKGITTQEGKDMADKKFQLDKKKADTDKDGKLSKYEEVKGEAIQKAMDNDEIVEMYHGGMACGCEGDCDGSCDGSMMDGIMGYDDVSGNPIPVGSHAENVRDDIDAKLSTDEYVLPAHVVKWHGLKHIQMMQSEAEMGLMSMQMDGLIQHAGDEESEDTVPCPECSGFGCEHCEGKGYHEADEDVPSKEMDIEEATVEVDNLLDDEEETEEPVSKTSKLPGMLKKQKFAFII
jgi:hypothetical protein